MLLLDVSAFARLTRPGLTIERPEQVAGWMREGEFGVCLPYNDWLAPRGSLD